MFITHKEIEKLVENKKFTFNNETGKTLRHLDTFQINMWWLNDTSSYFKIKNIIIWKYSYLIFIIKLCS